VSNSTSSRAQRQQFQNDLPFILKNLGALGQLVDGGKEHGLLTMSGSPNRIYPLVRIVVSHEDYAMIDRLIASGSAPQVEASVTNTMTTDSVPQWNTVAEIPGTEHPGQFGIVVIEDFMQQKRSSFLPAEAVENRGKRY